MSALKRVCLFLFLVTSVSLSNDCCFFFLLLLFPSRPVVPEAPAGIPHPFCVTLLSRKVHGVILNDKRYLFATDVVKLCGLQKAPARIKRTQCELSVSQLRTLGPGYGASYWRRLVPIEAAEAVMKEREAKRPKLSAAPVVSANNDNLL